MSKLPFSFDFHYFCLIRIVSLPAESFAVADYFIYLFVMRYLTVDGYFDGTGIRDAANGGYLEHDEVGISPDLSKRIDVWLEQYWKEFIKGFPDRDKVVELDEEGIRIARRLKKEFPEDKIGYFSDARMVALYDEKVHGGF